MDEQDYWLLMNLIFGTDHYTSHELLEDWFGVPGQRDHWQDQYSIGKRMAKKYSLAMLPDLCGSCHTRFGSTVGGRLRHYCPCCKPHNLPDYTTDFGKKLGLWERYTQAIGDSPVIYYLSSVFPMRHYDGPILGALDYDRVRSDY